MTETTIEPKDIQVGDRVMRPATVVNVGLNYVDLQYDYCPYKGTVPKDSLTAATITRPIDPDVLLVRRVLSEMYPNCAELYLAGNWDSLQNCKIALAAVKAVRAEVGK